LPIGCLGSFNPARARLTALEIVSIASSCPTTRCVKLLPYAINGWFRRHPAARGHTGPHVDDLGNIFGVTSECSCSSFPAILFSPALIVSSNFTSNWRFSRLNHTAARLRPFPFLWLRSLLISSALLIRAARANAALPAMRLHQPNRWLCPAATGLLSFPPPHCKNTELIKPR